MSRVFWLDLLERSVWTFLQAFAALIVTVQVVDLKADFMDYLTAAAIAGGLAVLKGLVASRVGNETPQLGARTYDAP